MSVIGSQSAYEGAEWNLQSECPSCLLFIVNLWLYFEIFDSQF